MDYLNNPQQQALSLLPLYGDAAIASLATNAIVSGQDGGTVKNLLVIPINIKLTVAGGSVSLFTLLAAAIPQIALLSPGLIWSGFFGVIRILAANGVSFSLIYKNAALVDFIVFEAVDIMQIANELPILSTHIAANVNQDIQVSGNLLIYRQP